MNHRSGVGVVLPSSAAGGSRAAATGFLRGIADLGRAATIRVIASYKACVEQRRQRRFLAALNDHGLRDLGLTRAQQSFEFEKPFGWP